MRNRKDLQDRKENKIFAVLAIFEVGLFVGMHDRLYIQLACDVYTLKEAIMAATITSIRLDTRLADEAAKILGVKNRTEAVHAALREVVALKKFRQLMKKYGGKLRFEAYGE
jgi:Arc/MetJ family transcription regulator